MSQRYIPEELADLPLMRTLERLVSSNPSIPGSNGDPNFDLYSSSSYFTNPKHIYAIREFIDMVKYTASLDEKNYVFNRLIRMKGCEIVLDEIEKYYPIDFDRSIDPETNLPFTYYEPKMLKLTIQVLELDTIRYDFIQVILEMFDSILYFLDHDISIRDLIIRIRVRLEDYLKSYNYKTYQLIKTKRFE